MRNDGNYPVYIRVNHGSKVAYIKSSFVATRKGVRVRKSTSGKEKVEIIDKIILKDCIDLIAGYIHKLNNYDCSKMSGVHALA